MIGGLGAPITLRDRTAGWLLETRDLSWAELTPAQLKSPVTQPDEATLEAWHQANAAEFTAPEVRKITYAWLTPEMLADTVQLDDAALREIYQQRIAEFQQPERRMVEQLVYPDAAAATAAKARLDAGQANFEQLAAERGLQLSDIDLGEMTEAALGAAGPAVFALDQPGVAARIVHSATGVRGLPELATRRSLRTALRRVLDAMPLRSLNSIVGSIETVMTGPG